MAVSRTRIIKEYLDENGNVIAYISRTFKDGKPAIFSGYVKLKDDFVVIADTTQQNIQYGFTSFNEVENNINNFFNLRYQNNPKKLIES